MRRRGHHLAPRRELATPGERLRPALVAAVLVVPAAAVTAVFKLGDESDGTWWVAIAGAVLAVLVVGAALASAVRVRERLDPGDLGP